jgi:hypothetical protein
VYSLRVFLELSLEDDAEHRLVFGQQDDLVGMQLDGRDIERRVDDARVAEARHRDASELRELDGERRAIAHQVEQILVQRRHRHARTMCVTRTMRK